MAIKASDLRVNNLVLVNGKITKIESIDEDGINISAEGGYYQGEASIEREAYFTKNWFGGNYLVEPIPLDSDILIKCGFEFVSGIWAKSAHDTRFKIEFAGSHCQLLNTGGYIGEPFQYLHQLMNIFYCLTNTEIEYKP